MAVRGRKPIATALKIQRGNPGKRRLPAGKPVPLGAIAPPVELTGRVKELWDTYIAPCHWLTWADGPKAYLWAVLQAEFESSTMVAARIGQLRAVGSEIGLDPSSRARLGASVEPSDPLQSDGPEESLDAFLARRPD